MTSSPDGTIRTWDAVFQPQLDALARLGAPITSVASTPSPREDERGPGHVLALRKGASIGRDAVPKRRPRRVVGPDGTAATMRGTTVVLQKGREARSARHRDRVNSVAFSPLGRISLRPRAATATHGSGMSPPASSFARSSTTLQYTMRSSALTGAGSLRPRFGRACGMWTTGRTFSVCRGTMEPSRPRPSTEAVEGSSRAAQTGRSVPTDATSAAESDDLMALAVP